MIRTEADLAGLAFAIIGTLKPLSAAERKLANSSKLPNKRLVANTLKAIRAGNDPLGDSFCSLRSAEQRRDSGATYTPFKIVDAMIEWAKDASPLPSRIVDAGSGSGRFLMRAATAFPKANLVAVDVDPLASLLLRANAMALGFSDRLTVKLCDYRSLSLPKISGRTLYIGNPPYVRHHDIGETWKAWFAETASAFGFKASKLAGLHIHFFLKTRQLASPGDLGAFITAAEWLDVNYGSVLRKLLADGLGGVALHVIDPKAQPFADAMTTGAITCFHIGNRPDSIALRSVDSLDELAPLRDGKLLSWTAIEHAPKWTPLLRGTPSKPADMIELGELFRVHRGQVTGSNAVWIASVAAQSLPDRFLLPAITRARELLDAGSLLSTDNHLKRVIDLPLNLADVDHAHRSAVEKFLAWARKNGAHQSYIARHRRAWWSVGYRDPAPILVTYMGRRPPHFTRNAVGARHLNIAHGLYPRENLSTDILDAVIRYLNGSLTGEGGRVYAGGLIKFEPKELERLLIPKLESLYAALDAEKVDNRATGSRRRRGDRQLPARAHGRAA